MSLTWNVPQSQTFVLWCEYGRLYGDFGEVPFLPNFIDRPDWQIRGLRFGEVCTNGFIHLKCMKYALEGGGKVGRFNGMRDRCLEFRKVLHPDRLFRG